MEKQKLLFYQILFFTFIFCASFFLFYNQVFSSRGKIYRSDINGHIRLTDQYFSGQKYLPHPGLHTVCNCFSKITGLSIQDSFIFVLSCCVTAIAALIYLIFLKFLKTDYSSEFLLMLAAFSMLLSAVYVPFFNKKIYLLQGSPNVWHNPTLIAVKPIAFLAFMLMIAFYSHPQYQGKIKYYIAIAVILFLSTWTKPNFVMSFLPAVCLWILLKYPKQWDLYLKSLILVFPSLLYLSFQYWNSYSGSDTNGIIFDFLGVMRAYSPNPYLSLFLGTAFPCLMLLFRFKKVFKNPYFLIGFINLVIAIIQMMFLAEWPKRYRHANFAWGYMIALQLMFIFATVEYFKWWAVEKKTTGQFIKISIVSVILGLHLASGLYYTIRIWSGGLYH